MSLKDECGVFGIWNHEEASRLTYLGLYAMQHRGQESAGIVSLSGQGHIHHKGLGLVGDVFQEENLLTLKGEVAIGHVRYSTTGQNLLTNAQPLVANLVNGPVALAHNGNIVNSEKLKASLQAEGAIFQGTNDTEILLHQLSRVPNSDMVECLKKSLPQLVGAYSFVILTHNKMLAMRDPLGFRPLVLGRKKNCRGEWASVLASETCAFDLIGAEFVREIEPGEIFWVDEKGENSSRFAEPSPASAKCIFEHVYFSRPDSVVFGKSVYESRKTMGKILAQESPVAADIVIPVPDGGVAAALGYSIQSGIPFELGIIRNHYVGRTFIQPTQAVRSFGVKIKLNPQAAVLSGKRVIVIDDSLVRGTTSKKIMSLIRSAGAKEVHLRIASPPVTGPCYYGVDTPQKSELIAANQKLEEIRKFVEADSLAYLSIQGLYAALNSDSQLGAHSSSLGRSKSFCAACFDGDYPTPY